MDSTNARIPFPSVTRGIASALRIFLVTTSAGSRRSILLSDNVQYVLVAWRRMDLDYRIKTTITFVAGRHLGAFQTGNHGIDDVCALNVHELETGTRVFCHLTCRYPSLGNHSFAATNSFLWSPPGQSQQQDTVRAGVEKYLRAERRHEDILRRGPAEWDRGGRLEARYQTA